MWCHECHGTPWRLQPPEQKPEKLNFYESFKSMQLEQTNHFSSIFIHEKNLQKTSTHLSVNNLGTMVASFPSQFLSFCPKNLGIRRAIECRCLVQSPNDHWPRHWVWFLKPQRCGSQTQNVVQKPLRGVQSRCTNSGPTRIVARGWTLRPRHWAR